MSWSGIFSNAAFHKVVLFIAAQEETLLAYHALAKAAGFESELARDGYEGLLLAHLACPDVVVLDLRDHQLDGGWIVHRLRAGVRSPPLPIVLVGAHSDAIDEATRVGRAGVYLIDPDDSLRLLRIVEGLLGSPLRPSHAMG